MTIQERISQELQRLQGADPELYKKASRLCEAVEKLINQLKVHLGEIKTQMAEYDDHDVFHSEKVLENIEKLLREDGIRRLSLLEAIVLRLCCYFHDSGMILPNCYSPLLADIEKAPTAELPEDLYPWLKKEKKLFSDVREQFFCPETEDGYGEFLLAELDKYQKYRMGLPEELSSEDRFLRTRHDYLRNTHGERAAEYAKNLLRFFDGIPYGGKSDLAQAVGDICAAHCWEFGEVRKMKSDAEIIDACPELRCNVQYLAMLLRLGDVIHFSSDRASPTAYAERTAMDTDSDLHWKTKFEDLHYTIKPDSSGVSIAYYGGFKDPKAYYFLQNHLNQVDEELQNYRAFMSDMRAEADADRYAIGLPTKVVRDGVRAIQFEPDLDLKFKLEQRKIITLLMGMRLYRDEFMCLRELYQNALDACRCMRAENEKKGLTGELKIEFGLSRDSGGDYLYCKDEGTGMTMDIVKNYLLRIGNSYYQSDEFRRANAQLGGKVAPVSEFGIGMLSCYMIASRIEVITRHHTRTTEPPIWICMEDSDDYGYFRTPGRIQNNQVGRHGTYVKLYLKEEYKKKATGFIPDEPRDAVFMLDEYNPKEDINITPETKEFLERFENSLYHRIQQFVHIPEKGIPVLVQGDEQKVQLFRSDERYDLAEKLASFDERGFLVSALFWSEHERPVLFGKQYSKPSSVTTDYLTQWLRYFDYYPCRFENDQLGISAKALIHLPNNADINYNSDVYGRMDIPVTSLSDGIYINGMPVSSENVDDELNDRGIRYHFTGKTRPRLTVDRGEIREVPEIVSAEQAVIRRQLQNMVVSQIREHFNSKPHALTESSKKYVFQYLFEKFGVSFAIGILRELSKDVLRDYRYFGATLFEWFHESTLELDTDFLAEDEDIATNGLILSALRNCAVLRFDEGKLRLQTTIPDEIHLEIVPAIYSRTIRADNWPEQFAQYDAVRNYTGLVPSHVFTLLDRRLSDGTQRLIESFGMTAVGSIYSGFDPVRLDELDWRDLIHALREESEACRIHSARSTFHLIQTGNKRYILYIYINPRPLTEADEAFLNQYCAGVPKYREGVEKGWSILFYNYKNGYVIAPGIVDREKMLELLPDAVWNRDDGLEYYFTDGTRAF